MLETFCYSLNSSVLQTCYPLRTERWIFSNQSLSQTECPVVFLLSLCLALLKFFIDIFFTSEKMALNSVLILLSFILIIQQNLIIQQKWLSRIFMRFTYKALSRWLKGCSEKLWFIRWQSEVLMWFLSVPLKPHLTL